MNHFSKSIFVTLMLTLALTSVLCQRTIPLTIGTNGNLTCCGTTTLLDQKNYPGVRWVIQDLRIDSFQIVGKNPTGRYPFSQSPNQPHSSSLSLVLSPSAPIGDWDYLILWWDKAHHIRTICDPKIAVRPSSSFSVTQIIIFVTLMITSIAFMITSIVFYKKWRTADRLLKEAREMRK